MHGHLRYTVKFLKDKVEDFETMSRSFKANGSESLDAISKSGYCDVKFKGGSFADFSLKFENRNSRPYITLISSKLRAREFDFVCHGDLLDVFLNVLRSIFRPIFSQLLNDAMNREVPKLLRQITNALSKIPVETELRGTGRGFYINYGLAGDPLLSNDQLRIPLITQFWYKNHKDDNPKTVFPTPGVFPPEPPAQHFCATVDTNLAFKSGVYAFNVSEKSVFILGKTFFQQLPSEKENFFNCDCEGDKCLTSLVEYTKQKCEKGNGIGIKGFVKVSSDLKPVDKGLMLYANGYGNFTLGWTEPEISKWANDNGINLLTFFADVSVLIHKNMTVRNLTLHGSIEIIPTKLTAVAGGFIISELITNKVQS